MRGVNFRTKRNTDVNDIQTNRELLFSSSLFPPVILFVRGGLLLPQTAPGAAEAAHADRKQDDPERHVPLIAGAGAGSACRSGGGSGSGISIRALSGGKSV